MREHLCARYTLARSQERAETPWGPVGVKVSTGWGVTRRKPEYEDLARIAREQGLPLEQVRSQLS